MTSSIFKEPRLNWMADPNIRPYVFVRPENRIKEPGQLHKMVDWFPHEVVYKNPLKMDQVKFADRILRLEEKAFGSSGMAMPRWVFYDCAIVPGFVAGFAGRKSAVKKSVLEALDIHPSDTEEWVPLSLFIIIPTMSVKNEWVAHNLCSVNSVLEKTEQYYGIGFLSKAFGLWYANVRTCCGMTQWTSPSLKLHANYGEFEVLTAYTPVHTYARTLTYRLKVRPELWRNFLSHGVDESFPDRFKPAGFEVDPQSDESLKLFQTKLEAGGGTYFLSSRETLAKELTSPHSVFVPKD